MKTSLLIAMLFVAIFTVVLYVLLSLYNKFFVASHLKNAEHYKDSLYSPNDIEEAIRAFIIRNRIK